MRRVAATVGLALFGVGAGLAVGAILMRRVDRATARLAPSSLAAQTSRAASNLRDRFKAALEEGGRSAAEREADLRREFNVPSVREAARRGASRKSRSEHGTTGGASRRR
ncbi:MAG: hypothetical protein M3252_01810 [Actinomycetota bacterium]|nr:hypothetical protein [Actinomycetota bacterium]